MRNSPTRTSDADLPSILSRMESLGDNCEFGAVQKAAGVEQIGLFRWASVSFKGLDLMLRDRLEHLDRLVELDVFFGTHGEAYIRNRRYGFFAHCATPPGPRSDAHLVAEMNRIRLLKRKFIADLSSGHKTFVLKGNTPGGIADVQPVVEAVAGYGPSQVLWVAVTDRPEDVGRVRRLGPNLMQGFIDRFSPAHNVMDASLESWRTVVLRADLLGVDQPQRARQPSPWERCLQAPERAFAGFAARHKLSRAGEAG